MINISSGNWQINDIQTVLFDKDGTFIDVHKYWGRIIEKRIESTCKYYNVSFDFYNDLCLSLGYNTITKKLIPQGPIALLARDEVINCLIQALDKIKIQAQIKDIETIFKQVHLDFLNELFDYVELIEDAKNLFDKLKEKNIQMAVVTSDMHQNTVEILKYLDLEKYFDLIIGKDDCVSAKKTGEPALIAIDRLKANPKTTIAIGDAPMDSQMATNAGLKASILVASGQIELNELEKYSKHSVKTLKELNIND